MKLLVNGVRFLFDLGVRQESKGTAIRKFCSRMGLSYIKFAQILAMQNIEGIFSEEDRRDIMSICDDCNPLSYKIVHKILVKEYGKRYIRDNFRKIARKPVGSASISQVHRVVLSSGRQAVLKVKRNDVVKTVDKDIRTIRILTHRFGWLFGLHNRSGSDTAFTYLKEWLMQETDFVNEVRNIKRYQEFADSVNGKVPGCVDIVMPKLYEEHCTDNVICIEYVPYKTIFHMDSSDPRITKALNSYIQLSFHALFHNMPVVWDGDPHGGNIYIDKDGNIGFLDMGLVFEMAPEDTKLTMELFLCAYLGLHERLYGLLKGYLKPGQDHEAFKAALKKYCEGRAGKPVSSFFMDVVLICVDFDFKPPKFLFQMAKAFVCLNGADGVYHNDAAGFELLERQVDEWLIEYGKDRLKEQAHRCLDEMFSVMNGEPPHISDLLRDGCRFLRTLK